MDERLIEREIEAWLMAQKKKRDAQHAGHLGFSHMGRCARMLYRWYVDGQNHATKRAALNTESGLAFQRVGLQMLAGAGRIDPMWIDMPEDDERRVVRSFDRRFFGHVDAYTVSDSLVEIKSFGLDDWRRVQRTDRIDFAYYAQAQMYLRYGAASQMLFMAINRDDRDMLNYHLITLHRDNRIGAELEDKARSILEAVDGKSPEPKCTCGQCDRSFAPMTYQQKNSTRWIKDDMTLRMSAKRI